eukprot:gene2245-2561_t
MSRTNLQKSCHRKKGKESTVTNRGGKRKMAEKEPEGGPVASPQLKPRSSNEQELETSTIQRSTGVHAPHHAVKTIEQLHFFSLLKIVFCCKMCLSQPTTELTSQQTFLILYLQMRKQ